MGKEMGGPTDHLVPAAILWENPGITREEFAELLSDVGGRKWRELDIANNLRSGLYGVAKFLNLPYTKEYKNIRRKNWDDDFKYSRKEESLWFRGHFERKGRFGVFRRSHEVVFEDKELEVYGKGDIISEPYEVGDYIDTPWQHSKEYEGLDLQVVEVLWTREIEERMGEHADMHTKQKVKTRGIKFKIEADEFLSIRSLTRKYPEYLPDAMYDFSTESGFLFPFEPKGSGREIEFRWFKVGDRYFLDTRYMLNKIGPNSCYVGDWRNRRGLGRGWYHPVRAEDRRGFSLTDLVLTAEAIRTRKWKVLGYNGNRRYFSGFMFSSSETLERYEKAVWDNEMSQWAKREGWTNSELLRRRIEMGMNKRPMSFEDRKKAFRRERRRIRRRQRKEAAEKAKREKQDNVPF